LFLGVIVSFRRSRQDRIPFFVAPIPGPGDNVGEIRIVALLDDETEAFVEIGLESILSRRSGAVVELVNGSIDLSSSGVLHRIGVVENGRSIAFEKPAFSATSLIVGRDIVRT
jgi:hypothetical protein